MKNGIYTGEVFHARHIPFHHKFTYKVFSFCADIDTLDDLHKKLKYFSFNHWNILSFWNKDHAKKDGSSIRSWLENAARDKNIDLTKSKIFVLCFPRLWGYVFNPLTVYFCFNLNKELEVIVYEVKNTFGEQHGYLMPVENDTNTIKQSTDKVFYVSPFIQMDCRYEFRVNLSEDNFDIAIHQFTPEDKILTATWNGQHQELNDHEILKAVRQNAFMTLKVILGIHWQAMKLWWKGAKFYHRKPKTLPDIT